MRLYEISYSIQQLLDAGIDPETGEILPETLEALDKLEMARMEKLENLACYIKDLEGDIAKLKAEKARLAARQATAEKRAEWLRVYLEANLRDNETIKSSRVVVSWRKNPISVNISDEDATREWLIANGDKDCLDYPQPKIVKKALKERLEAGEEIPGASLERRRSMQIK